MSEAHDYHVGRRSDRTYFSKPFDNQISSDKRPLRYLYKVLDQEGPDIFGTLHGELVIKEKKPKGRIEIKALFYDDDREIKRVQFIRYENNDPDEKWQLSFDSDEAERVMQALQSIKYANLGENESERFEDEDLQYRLAEFLKSLNMIDLQTPQLMQLIEALADRSSELRQLPEELGERGKLRMVAAAIRVAHRTKALDTLKEHIKNSELELEFQKLLDQNWWMLGGQYIERIPRRHWTTDETIDIMLRTADNYFELIELKRSTAQLFIEDHGKYIVSSEVNKAVNQAAHYIAEIEKNRPAIFMDHNVDLYKLRAKVLIGHIPDDTNENKKRESLRMYNSHLNHIEVITYDQLVRISQNVIDANFGESGQEIVEIEDEDIGT